MVFGVQRVPPGMWMWMCWVLAGAGGLAEGDPTSLSPVLWGDRPGWGSEPPLFGSHPGAGKDGTAMSPQQRLAPCGVRVGDEAELKAPKPLSLLHRPPSRAEEGGSAAPGLAGEISNPAGVARGKERGKAWQPGEPERRLAGLSFGSVLCFSFPGLGGLSPGTAGLCHVGVWWRGLGPWLVGSRQLSGDVGSFIPSRAEISDCGCFLACLRSCCCRGGSLGGCQSLGVSRVDGKH